MSRPFRWVEKGLEHRGNCLIEYLCICLLVLMLHGPLFEQNSETNKVDSLGDGES